MKVSRYTEIPRPASIRTPEQLEDVLTEVSTAVGDLVFKICDRRLPVTVLKLFARQAGDYQQIKQLIEQYGPASAATSDVSFYVDVATDLTIAGTPIELLGVRKPDPYRQGTGCGDCPVDDYERFAPMVVRRRPEYARFVTVGNDVSMVELWHPAFDVLAYLGPAAELPPAEQ